MEKSTTYGNHSGGLFQFIWHIPTAMGARRRATDFFSQKKYNEAIEKFTKAIGLYG